MARDLLLLNGMKYSQGLLFFVLAGFFGCEGDNDTLDSLNYKLNNQPKNQSTSTSTTNVAIISESSESSNVSKINHIVSLKKLNEVEEFQDYKPTLDKISFEESKLGNDFLINNTIQVQSNEETENQINYKIEYLSFEEFSDLFKLDNSEMKFWFHSFLFKEIFKAKLFFDLNIERQVNIIKQETVENIKMKESYCLYSEQKAFRKTVEISQNLGIVQVEKFEENLSELGVRKCLPGKEISGENWLLIARLADESDDFDHFLSIFPTDLIDQI